jgi:hypothetical protein
MNTLTWADIDFSLIQPGMITGGGQEGEQQTLVSFAEYLNVWLKTVQHRAIFFASGSQVNTRDTFTRGETRPADLFTDEGFNIGDFPNRFRRMFADTYFLLRSETFYSSEVLEDPVNYQDYELPNILNNDPVDGFAAYMGLTPEEYDIISDPFTASHYDLFTARMLRILFDIFTKYSIGELFVRDGWFYHNRPSRIKDNTVRRDVDETWVGNGSGGDTTFNPANTEAHDNYVNNIVQDSFNNVNVPYGNAGDQLAHRYSRKVISDTFVNIDYRSVEGHTFVWNFKDKNGSYVDVNFNTYGILRDNIRYVEDAFGTSGRDVIGTYDNNFPQVDLESGDAPINLNINDFKSAPQFKANGVYTTYSASGDYPPSPMPPDTNSNTGGYDNADHRTSFWITAPSVVYADANSEGFDYYVDPELWPADP